MRAPRRDITIFLWALLLGPALAQAVTQGQSLTAALEELRSRGLRLIFSSVLVQPGLTVNVDVSAADAASRSPEELARRILAPHGLTLEPIRPGLYSVVKTTAPPAARSPMRWTFMPVDTSSTRRALPRLSRS
jgi:hypothetical protein